QFAKEEYIELSKWYNDTCESTTLPKALGMLGDGWSGAWESFCDNKAFVDAGDVETILEAYRGKCAYMGVKMDNGSVSEQTYQDAFGALAQTVQSHVESLPSVMPRLRWHDTHNKLIRRGDGRRRKPDGCFIVGTTNNVLWQDISVAVEIKGDTMDAEHHLIRGQLLQDFIDMAET
ncbi:hypothetical protein IWW48_006394, partial [Coemansia sp. RSA 1200]